MENKSFFNATIDGRRINWRRNVKFPNATFISLRLKLLTRNERKHATIKKIPTNWYAITIPTNDEHGRLQSKHDGINETKIPR